MAKAIKHIQAGLLHIEVLGKIPDRQPERKRRGARANATPPAQCFYNLKLAYREVMLLLAANFGSRDWVVTATFNDSNLPKDKKGAGKFLQQKYFRKLRAVRRRRGEELKYLYAIEGWHGKQSSSFLCEDGTLEDRRIHIHFVVNDTGPGTLEELRSLWPGGGYVRIEPLDVHYYEALARYLTKEAREFGRAKPGDRTWGRSMNLTEYQVEYIEIPTDSITLTPPVGAVDYTSFHEKNPFGFSDCVGAMYLLFPDASNPGCSYTKGRNRGKPPNN